jgi:peptidoglycan hydrolase-like protein with peptidoglycan-binding domain
MRREVVMRRFFVAAIAAAIVVVTAGLATAASGATRVINWPTIRQGARGENVRTIQLLLAARGLGTVIDGKYGSATAASIKYFQAAVRLPVDGRVGPRTWPKLVISIRRGSRGDAVLAVERQLRIRYGYRSVTIDGFLGPRDDAAVRNVQFNHGLRVDGIVGGATWKAIVVG